MLPLCTKHIPRDQAEREKKKKIGWTLIKGKGLERSRRKHIPWSQYIDLKVILVSKVLVISKNGQSCSQAGKNVTDEQSVKLSLKLNLYPGTL